MIEAARFLGGLGLLLLGLALLTHGLQAVAGDVLRRTLARATRTPATAALAGAGTTALVQSSGATSVAAVGFVGAGLLTFPQALGILLGANVGTTATGWIVTLVGFKLEIGALAGLLVLVGVMLRLFGHGHVRDAGWAVAGFGLLFVGIAELQAAMVGLEGKLTPASFPPDTLLGRIQLVGIGVVVTLVTQSSSAGVATALAAIAAGTITFPQAAALVIGMAIGTSSTAALATIGGSTAMRRTGFAHVIFNALNAGMAFLLLGPFTALMDAAIGGGTRSFPQISLVAFHTTFNVLGVILVLPFTHAFARLVIRLFPGDEAELSLDLDDRLLAHPSSATVAAQAAVAQIAAATFEMARRVIASHGTVDVARLAAPVDLAADEVRRFAERIPVPVEPGPARDRHVAVLNAIDHLARLGRRLCQTRRVQTCRGEPELERGLAAIGEALAHPTAPAVEELRRQLRRERRGLRRRILDDASRRRLGVDATLGRLDALRWQYRVAGHVAQILGHLEEKPAESKRGAAEARTGSPDGD